jgi:hypothetical protein
VRLLTALPFDGRLDYARLVGCPANTTAMIESREVRTSWPTVRGEYRGRRKSKLLIRNTRRSPGSLGFLMKHFWKCVDAVTFFAAILLTSIAHPLFIFSDYATRKRHRII